MDKGLRGKVAIVAGGAREEGLTAAEALLRDGATVAIWDLDEDVLGSARQELEGQGLDANFRRVDVVDFQDVQIAFDAVCQTHGKVDVFVNSCILKRTFMVGPERKEWHHFWEIDPSRFKRELEVNFAGTFNCTSVAARHMIARRRGSIINSGTSPHTQRSGLHIPYGQAAAAIELFSLAAAVQLEPYDVRLNVVASGGPVNFRHQDDPKKLPPDVAAPLVRYLASDLSAKVSGRVWVATEFQEGKPDLGVIAQEEKKSSAGNLHR